MLSGTRKAKYYPKGGLLANISGLFDWPAIGICRSMSEKKSEDPHESKEGNDYKEGYRITKIQLPSVTVTVHVEWQKPLVLEWQKPPHP